MWLWGNIFCLMFCKFCTSFSSEWSLVSGPIFLYTPVLSLPLIETTGWSNCLPELVATSLRKVSITQSSELPHTKNCIQLSHTKPCFILTEVTNKNEVQVWTSGCFFPDFLCSVKDIQCNRTLKYVTYQQCNGKQSGFSVYYGYNYTVKCNCNWLRHTEVSHGTLYSFGQSKFQFLIGG